MAVPLSTRDDPGIVSDESFDRGASLMMHERVPVLGAGHMRIELDRKSLFALASDTRLKILKALQPMRRTVSQLSEVLNVDKAAVHRHLKKMEEGGLVKRYEEHGFVYYGLTWKAKDLLTPNENTKIVILLSATWLLLLGALLFLAAGLMAEQGNDYLYDLLPTAGEQFGQDSDAAPGPETPYWTAWALPSMVLGASAAVAALLTFWRLRTPFQMPPHDSAAVEDQAQPSPDDLD